MSLAQGFLDTEVSNLLVFCLIRGAAETAAQEELSFNHEPPHQVGNFIEQNTVTTNTVSTDTVSTQLTKTLTTLNQ